MRRDKGFTLIELMVVIAILGILVASAYPTYQTFRQRAVGSEATRVMKQLIQAQIIYYLEHEHYFPNSSDPNPHSANPLEVFVAHTDSPNDNEILLVKDRLKVNLTPGHFLDYSIEYDEANKIITMQVTASFPIFKNGHNGIYVDLDGNGKIINYYTF